MPRPLACLFEHPAPFPGPLCDQPFAIPFYRPGSKGSGRRDPAPGLKAGRRPSQAYSPGVWDRRAHSERPRHPPRSPEDPTSALNIWSSEGLPRNSQSTSASHRPREP